MSSYGSCKLCDRGIFNYIPGPYTQVSDNTTPLNRTSFCIGLESHDIAGISAKSILKPSQSLPRPWTSRTFGHMEAGSLRSSTITLLSSALGIGVLSLPQAFEKAGLAFGVMFLITGAMIAYWSLNCLSHSGFKFQAVNYSDIMYKRFGPSIGVTGYGMELLEDRVILAIIFNLLVYPLGCAKNLYVLRHASVLIVVVILYTALVIIVQAPSYIMLNLDSDAYSTNFSLAHFNITSLSAFNLTIIAFSCHIIVFPVRKELAHPSDRRMEKIITRSVALELFLYLSIGVLGYLSTLQNTPDLVIFREPLGPSDIGMSVSRVLMIVSLNFAVPLRINPCRLQICLLTGKEQTTFNRCYITAMLLTSVGTLAVLFPNIYDEMSILGGTVGCLVSLTIPGILYMSENMNPTWKRVGSAMITVIGTGIAFTSAVYTIKTKILGVV